MSTRCPALKKCRSAAKRRCRITLAVASSNTRKYRPGCRRNERRFAGKAFFQCGHKARYVTSARTCATLGWDGPGSGSFTEKIRMRTPRCSRERISLRTKVSESRGQLRSEEHTSELQSQSNLVCRLLLEKKKKKKKINI